MKTATLRKALSLAKPCLGPSDSPLPILSHICFMPDCVYAYNDVMATIVEEATGLSCGLHGDTLIGLLDAAGVDELKIKLDKGKGFAQLDVGNGWIKVPSLPDTDFLFGLPEIVPVLKLRITDEVRRALELCLMSVGTDSLKPEFAGVTVIFAKGQAIFFSSNNDTASRYVATDKIMGRKEIAFVLPAAACEQLLKLQSSVGDGMMLVGDEATLITFGKGEKTEATLVSKLLTAGADFNTIFNRHAAGTPAPTPPTLAAELKKAAVLLGKESVKLCTLRFEGGELMIDAAGVLGSMESVISFEDKKALGAVRVDPELVLRAIPYTSHMAVNAGESLVLSGGGYTVVIASEGGTSADAAA